MKRTITKIDNLKSRSLSLPYRTKRRIHGVIFMLPWLIGFILLFAKPVIETIVYSVNNVSVGKYGGMERNFVGISNYINLFRIEVSSGGQQFIRVIINENINILIKTPMIVIFSLFCAILVNANFKGRGIARVIFFLPIVTGLPVVTNLVMTSTGGDITNYMVSEAFDSDMIINFLRTSTFLPMAVSEFIADVANNVFNLISQAGVQILVFLAGLQSINPELYEVAQIEGANSYEVFWKITLPMLTDITIFAVIYTFVDLFLTSSISNEIYQFAFAKNNIGVGSALSMVYLVNVLIDLMLLLLIFKKVVGSKNATN